MLPWETHSVRKFCALPLILASLTFCSPDDQSSELLEGTSDSTTDRLLELHRTMIWGL